MDAPVRLIVVDDEADLRDAVAEYLGRQGFAVRRAAHGRELDRLLAEEPAELVLLDVHMPGEDGFAIAARLGQRAGLAVVMLTSAGAVEDRLRGLGAGVEDYIVKPFELRELRARLRAILARLRPPGTAAAAPAPAAPPPQPARELVWLGRVGLDPGARCLRGTAGEAVPLTAMEFGLLEVFLRHPNQVLSRDRLMDLAGQRERDAQDRAIDIRITRLRRKIEADPARPTVIRTVRGEGYVFVPPRGGSRASPE